MILKRKYTNLLVYTYYKITHILYQNYSIRYTLLSLFNNSLIILLNTKIIRKKVKTRI